MKKIILIITLLLSVGLGFSQDVKLTARAKNTVVVGERFSLVYQANAGVNNFTPPDLSAFQVIMGPSKSSSSSYNIVNGNVSQSSTTGFTYYLVAKKTGTFKISPAQIKLKGKVVKSNEITIKVVDRGTQVNNNTNNSNVQNGSNQNTSANGISNSDLYIRTHLSKGTVYEGEHLIATVKIYVKPGIGLAGFDEIEMPSFNGFYSQEIPTSNNISFVAENINGVTYNVGVLQKSILYPQKSGKITVEPFDITCVVQQRVRRRRSRNFFDDFFNSGYQNIKRKIRSNKAIVNVKPLPANKPKDFTGAVGSLNIKASVDKTELSSDEPIVLKVKISGNGNMKLISEPEINFPPDFDVYDPKIKNNYKNDANGSHGNIEYEYLMIPRHGGEFKIPKIKLSYFDVKQRRYITKSTDKILINVKRGEGEPNTNSVVSNVAKEDVQYLGNDIRFIKTNDVKLRKKDNFIFGTLWFYLVYIISILGFIIIFILKRKQIKENSNHLLVKNKRANKVAKQRFKLANKHLKDNNSEQFYQEITNAVWGYLSDKLGIQLANLNKDTAIETLIDKGICDDNIAELKSVLDTCEFEQYAPSKSSAQMHDVYNKSITLISAFENKI